MLDESASRVAGVCLLRLAHRRTLNSCQPTDLCMTYMRSYLCDLLCLWDRLVNFRREVSIRLDDRPVRHPPDPSSLCPAVADDVIVAVPTERVSDQMLCSQECIGERGGW